jgi:hypothetical protein
MGSLRHNTETIPMKWLGIFVEFGGQGGIRTHAHRRHPAYWTAPVKNGLSFFRRPVFRQKIALIPLDFEG